METMLPMPMLPAGFQLVRDPSTGQLMVLPTAPTIGAIYVVALNTPPQIISPIIKHIINRTHPYNYQQRFISVYFVLLFIAIVFVLATFDCCC